MCIDEVWIYRKSSALPADAEVYAKVAEVDRGVGPD
jgi:hypothetical protein